LSKEWKEVIATLKGGLIIEAQGASIKGKEKIKKRKGRFRLVLLFGNEMKRSGIWIFGLPYGWLVFSWNDGFCSFPKKK
jgi:hypothetical protein